MSITALFVGGPMDGQVRALEEAMPVYDVAVQPKIELVDDLDERVTPQRARYHRASEPIPRNGPLTYRYTFHRVIR